MEVPSTPLPIVIARQPIFDRQHHVFGYELLIRSQQATLNTEQADFDGDLATTRLIHTVFQELGIERVIDHKLAFVNLTRQFLLDTQPLPFPPEQVILELLEDIELDDQLLRAIELLMDQGYQIALDDFVFDERWLPLLKRQPIIKLDILAHTPTSLAEQIDLLSSYRVRLLAEKVETQADYQRCLALGFELFQGYFFCHPEYLAIAPLPAYQLAFLKLIIQLQQPETDLEEVEALISAEVALSQQLIRLLTSAAVGMRHIDSVHKAIVVLGLKALKIWTTMVVMRQLMAEHEIELLNLVLVRANMLKQMAADYQCEPEQAFLVGLFSNIDAVLNRPFPLILSQLPLTDEIKQAITTYNGPLGQMLDTMLLYEQGNWAALNTRSVSLESMGQYYLHATEWAIKARHII